MRIIFRLAELQVNYHVLAGVKVITGFCTNFKDFTNMNGRNQQEVMIE